MGNTVAAMLMSALVVATATPASAQTKYYARQRLSSVTAPATPAQPPKTTCSAFTPKKWIGPGSTCGQIVWDGNPSTRATRCEAEAKAQGSTQGLCLSYTNSTLLYCRGGVLADQNSTDFEGATCSM